MDSRAARSGGWLRRFGRDRRGGFGIMLAVAALPLTVAVGAGIDTSHVLTARSDLQNATDEAALSLAHQAYSATPQAAADAYALKWVQANFNRPDATAPTVSTITSATQVEVKGASQVQTFFAGLLGVSSIRVNADSVVNRSLKHVELALVLDNTGSMADDNKIGTLKTAAGQLVDTLTNSAAGSGDPNVLKIGVVPFAQTVNIGASNQNQTWLAHSSPYALDPDQNQDRMLGFQLLGIPWAGCVEDRPMPYDVLDTAPSVAVPNSMFVPYFAPDEPDDGTKYGAVNSNWNNNYIPDATTSTDWLARQNNIAKYPANGLAAVKPGASSKSVYPNPGPNWGCLVQPLMQLTPIRSTNDAKAVHDELNAMQPNGDTEIPVGLVWGWHVLSPNLPFADGAAYATPNTLKIVVLVTDGQNTYNQGNNAGDQSWYTSLGYLATHRISKGGPSAVGGSSTQGDFTNVAAALDDRLTKLCANMQASNIIIYTVPVEVTDTNIKTRLQACATDSSHYIDASSTAQLTAAFNNIAGQISALRIAR